jgi:hypothetical protein
MVAALFAVGMMASAAAPKQIDIAEQTMGMRADPLLSVDINRTEIVSRVMGKWQSEIAATQRDSLKQKLTGLRADRPLAASIVGTFDGVLEILSGQEKNDAAGGTTSSRLESAKLLGDTDKDLVYTPLAPCRLFDTRAGQSSALGQLGGVFTADSGRNIVPAGACSIPTTEVNSLLVSLTTLNNTPNSGGYISLLAPAAPVTTTTDIFNLGSQWSAANSVVRTGTAGQFTVYVATANAHVVVDVLGYFTRPQATALQCTTVAGAALALAAGASGQANATCAAGYFVTGGACENSGTGGLEIDTFIPGNGYRCWAKNVSAGPLNMTPHAQCCRIPGK